jgi:putative hydrolase of the HAD superfamily
MIADRHLSWCLLFDWGDTLMRVYAEYQGPMCEWPKVSAMPHAREVLQQVRPRWSLALVTNAADSDPDQIEQALARADLDGLMDRIYCHKTTGLLKPSREYFEHVLSDLGMPAARGVMVGDDYENDIIAACRVGIRGIWLNNEDDTSRQGPMIRTIFDLKELPAALTDWRVGGGKQ